MDGFSLELYASLGREFLRSSYIKEAAKKNVGKGSREDEAGSEVRVRSSRRGRASAVAVLQPS